MDTYSSEYVDEKMFTSMKPLRDEIIKEGIKFADASHLACVIHSNCDFFITTDDRILKYRGDRIKVISPVDFIVVKEE